MMNLRIAIGRCLSAALVCGFVSTAAFAEDDDGAKEAAKPAPVDKRMEEEIRYIKALVENNYPDFAAPVIENCRKRWPDSAARIAALEMAARLRLGQFDSVIAEIAKETDKTSSKYWAMNLALADAYFAQSKNAECEKIYKAFFSSVKTPKEDIRQLYIESAFKWAQMLIMQKKEADATEVYDGLLTQLKGEDNKDLWLTVATEDAQLLLKLASEDERNSASFLGRADKIISKLLWENERILIFGRAVAMKAHVYLLRGKLNTAQETVETYLPQLKEIHDNLLEQDPDGREGYLRQSPMPQCRYLLAKMLWDAAEKEAKKPADPKTDEAVASLIFGEKKNGKRNGAGCYNHAVNVFIKYPESTWAAAAGELCEKIERFVKERFKKEIKTSVTPEQKIKVRRMQFLAANEAYRNNDFEGAIPAFYKVLQQFPEVPESLPALGNLVVCYLNIAADAKQNKKEELLEECSINAEAIECQIGERFALFPKEYQTVAGDQVLRLAGMEHDMGSRARSDRLYDMYFSNYPTHHQAAQKVAQFAQKAYTDENWEKAAHFYELICSNYTNSPYYVASVQRMASVSNKLGNRADEIVWLKKFVQVAKKASDKAAAQYNVAYAQQRDGVAMLKEAETNGSEEVSAELRKNGQRNLVFAAKEFTTLVKMAEDAEKDKLATAEDKKTFSKMRERAMYLIGDSLQRMPAGSTKATDPRLLAAAKYEAYLEAFPRGEFAPNVLVKLGGIYAATTNTVKQHEVFGRLERDFPESDEAKNSKPRLAKTLIEMGLKSDGVKQYAEMINTDGKYTMHQFLAAGDALLEAGSKDAMETAISGYDKALVLAGTNSLSVSSRAKLGKAKALYHLNRLVEAQEILETFIEDPVLSKTTLVLDANFILMDVASRAGSREKDDDARQRCFGTAIGALKKVKTRAGNDKRKIDELDLMLGDIHQRRMVAEKDMGLEEQAQETLGLAITSFNVFIMSHRPESAEEIEEQKKVDPNYKGTTLDTMTGWQIQNLQRAYASVLPLMVEKKFEKKEDAKENAELAIKYAKEYLEWFPDGKHRTLVQNMLNQANAQL